MWELNELIHGKDLTRSKARDKYLLSHLLSNWKSSAVTMRAKIFTDRGSQSTSNKEFWTKHLSLIIKLSVNILQAIQQQTKPPSLVLICSSHSRVEIPDSKGAARIFQLPNWHYFFFFFLPILTV